MSFLSSRKSLILGTVGVGAIAALSAGCTYVGGVFGIRSGYDSPDYEVVEALPGEVEIRRYGPRLVAESTVPDTGDREAENRAFMLLFDYITGENESRDEVAMTVPVQTESGESEGEEIAMTVPVQTDSDGTGDLRMLFFFPGDYTLETAPIPTDDRVTLREIPARTEAALRFRGRMTDAREERYSSELLDALDSTGWQPSGETVSYVYDGPFTIPFLRRSEVAVEVTER